MTPDQKDITVRPRLSTVRCPGYMHHRDTDRAGPLCRCELPDPACHGATGQCSDHSAERSRRSRDPRSPVWLANVAGVTVVLAGLFNDHVRAGQSGDAICTLRQHL